MSNPVLCLFGRNDLTSMNSGKLAAQMAHGATMLEKRVLNHTSSEILRLHHEWSISTSSGFGTKLVFAINESQFPLIEELHTNDGRFKDSIFGTIHDPTYPIRDGKVTHHIPLNTGCFLFFDAEVIENKTTSFFRKKGIDLHMD